VGFRETSLLNVRIKLTNLLEWNVVFHLLGYQGCLGVLGAERGLPGWPGVVMYF